MCNFISWVENKVTGKIYWMNDERCLRLHKSRNRDYYDDPSEGYRPLIDFQNYCGHSAIIEYYHLCDLLYYHREVPSHLVPKPIKKEFDDGLMNQMKHACYRPEYRVWIDNDGFMYEYNTGRGSRFENIFPKT